MALWEIAQVNIALPTKPLSEPELDWFTSALDAVNAVADAAPGFRWRLQTEDGDATAVRGFGDDRMIVNMSVWASIEQLADLRTATPTIWRCCVSGDRDSADSGRLIRSSGGYRAGIDRRSAKPRSG